MIISDLTLLKNNDVSHLEFSKPQELKAPFNLSNHTVGACLRSYKAFLSLQT